MNPVQPAAIDLTDAPVNGPTPRPGAAPVTSGRRDTTSQVLIYIFSAVPLLALAVCVPFAWGWGLGWIDVALAVAFYVLSGIGITAGFHRCFTHSSYRPRRGLKIGLAVAGELALQGPIIDWVADHRRHHAFSDREGDPHSPWLFGTSAAALARGFWHAHMGWIFNRDLTNQRRFAPICSPIAISGPSTSSFRS